MCLRVGGVAYILMPRECRFPCCYGPPESGRQLAPLTLERQRCLGQPGEAAHWAASTVQCSAWHETVAGGQGHSLHCMGLLMSGSAAAVQLRLLTARGCLGAAYVSPGASDHVVLWKRGGPSVCSCCCNCSKLASWSPYTAVPCRPIGAGCVVCGPCNAVHCSANLDPSAAGAATGRRATCKPLCSCAMHMGTSSLNPDQIQTPVEARGAYGSQNCLAASAQPVGTNHWNVLMHQSLHVTSHAYGGMHTKDSIRC